MEIVHVDFRSMLAIHALDCICIFFCKNYSFYIFNIVAFLLYKCFKLFVSYSGMLCSILLNEASSVIAFSNYVAKRGCFVLIIFVQKMAEQSNN